MDNNVEILLGNQKNIDSINVNGYSKIELTNNVSKLTEFTVNDVVNSTEVFDAEREANPVYRIYGRIEWMSLLNGLNAEYSALKDFFDPYTGNSKSILNSFDFYLVAPSSGQSYINISNTNHYKRSFEVIAGKDDFEIYNAGFSNNVYGEQVYSFSFKSDFNVTTLFDNFGFPVTELFIYAQYKSLPAPAPIEQMSYTTWASNGTESKATLNKKDLEVGDIVETNSGGDIYDLVEYLPTEYYQAQISSQTFYIRTYYYQGYQRWLEWSYNPFIPLQLRYFDSTVNYAPLSEIVEYSTTLDVFDVNNPTDKINITKSSKQSLTTSLQTINKWNTQSSLNYSWVATTGYLEFDNTGTYNITFKTNIRLSQDTDKYIAETYLEELAGTGWDTIPNTIRKYRINSPIQGTNIVRGFYSEDRIRIRTRLIPNPDERKVERIPDYALMNLTEGKYIWRDILPQGYIDPLTGDGVDYPFFNQRRYLFEPIVFDVPPNLNEDLTLKHDNTLTVFNEISYWQNATNLDKTPITELDNIGKPCQ